MGRIRRQGQGRPRPWRQRQGPWKPWSWTWQGQGGEGMDSRDQAGTFGEGRQDQVLGGDLPLMGPIKEHEIIDLFLGPALKDEVLKIMPVQNQTRAGQRTRFKASVAIGDYNGHVGLGVKCSKEVVTAIRGAIIMAKLSIVPVRRGFWAPSWASPTPCPAR